MRSIRNAPKRAINLSLNSKVLDMARDMGMNISQTVLKQYWERWNEDNAEAIAAYNERIEREGLFSDRVRTFMRPQHDQDAA
jgi:antitoxin CcdA